MYTLIYCLDLDFPVSEQEGVVEIITDNKYLANMSLLPLSVSQADITNQLLTSDLDTALQTITKWSELIRSEWAQLVSVQMS